MPGHPDNEPPRPPKPGAGGISIRDARRAFHLCLSAFRRCTLETAALGGVKWNHPSNRRSAGQMYSRPREEFRADFIGLLRRTLSRPALRAVFAVYLTSRPAHKNQIRLACEGATIVGTRLLLNDAGCGLYPPAAYFRRTPR